MGQMLSKLSGKTGWCMCLRGGLHMTLTLSIAGSHLSQEDSCGGLGGTADIPVDRGFLVWRSGCSGARPGKQHLPGRAWPPEIC